MPNWSQIDKVIEAYNEHGSQRKAAKALGMSRRSFRRYLDQGNAHGYEADPGFKVTKVSKTLNKKGEVLQKSVVTKLAPTEDHQTREGKIARRSTLYGADGSVVAEWVIRKPEDQQVDDYLKALDDHFVKDTVRLSAPPVLQSDFSEEDLALFMSIDEHLNVKLVSDLCDEEYGLEEAVTLIMDKFKRLVSRTNKTKKALFVNLGDQFHSNDHMNVTPQSKHVLDSDKSFWTLSGAAIDLNRQKIEYLLNYYDELEIHGVGGNHDIDAQGWLFRCLHIAYENENRVNVKFYPDEAMVYQHGNTFLGFHHGHRLKPDVMAGAFADRYNTEYGNTQMRYLHSGHIHHDSEKDLWGGFKWHSHRTIAPKDWYSKSHGYITRQSMKSYVYNVEEGEVANYVTSLVNKGA